MREHFNMQNANQTKLSGKITAIINACPPIPSCKPIVVARVIKIAQSHESTFHLIVSWWFQVKVTFAPNLSSLTHWLDERKSKTSAEIFFTTKRQVPKWNMALKPPKQLVKTKGSPYRKRGWRMNWNFWLFFLKKYKVEFIWNGVKFITTSLEWCN